MRRCVCGRDDSLDPLIVLIDTRNIILTPPPTNKPNQVSLLAVSSAGLLVAGSACNNPGGFGACCIQACSMPYGCDPPLSVCACVRLLGWSISALSIGSPTISTPSTGMLSLDGSTFHPSPPADAAAVSSSFYSPERFVLT
jgi:hypothetical protein